MKYLITFLVLFTISSFASANQWVSGKVNRLEEYGSFGGGNYQVLISLDEQLWDSSGTEGPTNCTISFSVTIGAQGVDEEIKDRIFSLALSAYMADKRLSLYVNTSTGPYCKVQIGSIGSPTF